MSIQAQSSVLYLVVGMFNAAPGKTYLDQFTSSIDAGQSINELAQSLSQTGAFLSLYPNSLSDTEFATNYLNSLVGSATSEQDKAWAINWMTDLLVSGSSRAEAMLAATNALNSLPHDHPQWGAAAQIFESKVQAAKTYSVDQGQSSTSLEELQNVVAVDSTTESASIVGTWYVPKEVDENPVIFHFFPDGSYIVMENGLERGTYSWDQSADSLSVSVAVDFNGDNLGLNSFTSITTEIQDPALNLTVAGHPHLESNGTFSLNAVQSDSSNKLVGSWLYGSVAEDNFAFFTFAADGTFVAVDRDAAIGQALYEFGTYAWDQPTGVLTFNSDGSGGVGVDGVVVNKHNATYQVSSSDNSWSLSDSDGVIQFQPVDLFG